VTRAGPGDSWLESATREVDTWPLLRCAGDGWAITRDRSDRRDIALYESGQVRRQRTCDGRPSSLRRLFVHDRNDFTDWMNANAAPFYLAAAGGHSAGGSTRRT